MNFDVNVWGLRVVGALVEYDYEEGPGYDIDGIDDIGFTSADGVECWMPSEFVARLSDWSEFAEAVLEAAMDARDE